MKKTLLVVALGAVALVAGCGDDDKGKTSTPATPAQTTATGAGKSSKALTELAETRRLVGEGVAAYEKGDMAAATELITDAYLEHFELVEHDLDEADHKLNESLEHGIRDDLRAKIGAGAPVAEVRSLHAKIERDLAKAKLELKAAAA